MAVYGNGRDGRDHDGNSPGVIVVAVAENEPFGTRKVYAQGTRVFRERPALSGIEKNAFRAGADPQSESVFRGQIPNGPIVDQHGYPNGWIIHF
jgi:hypothetical protein